MIPDWWSIELFNERVLLEILVDQKIIKRNQGVIMSALSDFKEVLQEVSDDVDAFIAANTGGASDADLVAATTQLRAIAAKLAPPAPPAPPAA